MNLKISNKIQIAIQINVLLTICVGILIRMDLFNINPTTALILNLLINNILAFIYGYIISRKISKPVTQMKNLVKIVAQGDLTQRDEIQSTDEVGDLAKWFLVLQEKFQGIIQNVTSNTASLSTATEVLANGSKDMTDNANDMKQKAKKMNLAGDSLSKNINDMSEMTEKMSNSLDIISNSVQNLTESVSDEVKQVAEEAKLAQLADDKAKQTSELMQKLGESAKEIDKILEVINSIADQTNLLALNATIEAASAGDAGKGFAVVATEVKELAKQSSNATELIAKQVEDVQQNTIASINAIKDIANIIQQVNEISTNISDAVDVQYKTTDEIANNLSDINSKATEITTKLKNAANYADEVASNINDVNNGAINTAQCADETMDSAKEMEELSSTLLKVVKQFKV